MERSLKIVAIVTGVTSTLGVILLLGSLFTSVWIHGDLPTTSVRNVTQGVTIITNTSGSCSEGVFVKCCYKVVNSTYHSTSSSGNSTYNQDNCYIRGKKDFHGQMWAGFKAVQVFASLCLICTLLGVLVSWLFYCVGKLQDRTLVPLVQMLLLYSAVLFLIIAVIMMGAEKTKFTALLQPEIGGSLYMAVVADVAILAAAMMSTIAFVLLRRYTIPQYENL